MSMAVGKRGKKRREATLPARAGGGAAGGPSLVPQAHGGALLSGGKPGNRGGGQAGLAHAERRRARVERDEAIDDAVTGHVEKLSKLVGQLVDEAKGEQYRCSCGLWGPKRPKLALREAADVLRLLMAAEKKPGDTTTDIPIQDNVHAGGPLVPGQIPTSGPNP